MKYIEYSLTCVAIIAISMFLSKIIDKPLWDCIIFQSIFMIMFDVVSIKNLLEE